MAFLAESDEEVQAGGAALTPRVAVVKRFRRDSDLTSPDTLSSSDSPSSFVLVESPRRDTCGQVAQAQSRPPARSLLQATPKTRPRTGPLPPPTFPLQGRLDTPPAFGGLPAPCFCPPQTDRFPFTVGPTGTTTARVPIPAWESQPASHITHSGTQPQVPRANPSALQGLRKSQSQLHQARWQKALHMWQLLLHCIQHGGSGHGTKQPFFTTSFQPFATPVRYHSRQAHYQLILLPGRL